MTPRAAKLGPDPHRGRGLAVLGAYAKGVAVLPRILATPHLPAPAVRAIARHRFARMVLHAQRSSPHYADRLAGVDVDALRRDGDTRRVPLLDKATLRDEADRLLCRGVNPERLTSRSSSGSSGIPTRVRFDPIAELPRRVQELRLLTAHGFRLTDRQLIFDHPGHLSERPFGPQRLGLWRRIPYPWQLPIDEGIALIERERYEVLHGVLSSLRLLALAVRDRGGLAYRPRLVVTKGELLDHATRTLVESTLRSPLVDYYATEEVGIIGWQPPGGGGYALDQDLVFTEVVDPSTGEPMPPGHVGEIVVSNLYMRAMPILRYRTGDLGVIDSAPAPGLGLPLLRELRGRAMDCIVTPQGEAHHPFVMLGVLEESPELERYRVRQVAVDHVVVAIRTRPEVGAERRGEVEARIRAALAKRLGEDVRVEVTALAEGTPAVGEKLPLVQGLGLDLEALAGRRVRL